MLVTLMIIIFIIAIAAIVGGGQSTTDHLRDNLQPHHQDNKKNTLSNFHREGNDRSYRNYRGFNSDDDFGDGRNDIYFDKS